MMLVSISRVTKDGCLHGARLSSGLEAVAADLAQPSTAAVEVDWKTHFDGGSVLDQRMLVYPDGRHALFSRLASVEAIVGSDVAFFEGTRARYGSVDVVDADSLHVLFDGEGEHDPICLPLSHPALPGSIVATVRFGELPSVGVDITDEVLALRHSDLAKLKDMSLPGSGDLPPGLAARLFGASSVEMVGAISAFFGRLPSAGNAGARVAREITAAEFESRRQVHYGLAFSTLAPGL